MASRFPTSRALAVLELLQTHGQLSGSDLATRLGVDARSVRRYVAKLEEMGIPITTDRGAHGGYALVSGYKLPPMMFTYDEVCVLSLGIAAVRGFGLADATEALAGAQAKIERIVPRNLQDKMRSVAEMVRFEQVKQAILPDRSFLPVLSSSAHNRAGVLLRYRDFSSKRSEREFDPYGLAFVSGRWYVSGYCHLRQDLRTFRLDRVESVASQTREFERPPKFDVMAHVRASIATFPRTYTITVRMETDLESAQSEILPALGLLEKSKNGVVLQSQADDLDWFARELARLPWRLQVVEPADLRDALEQHARRLLKRK